MTQRQALLRARRLFGATGVAEERRCSLFDRPGRDGMRGCTGRHVKPCSGDRRYYIVGWRSPLACHIQGVGETWEAALAGKGDR